MADNVEKRGTSAKGNISKGMRCSYDANFKIMVFKHAEQTNSCEVARKYSVSEANIRRWKQQKQKLTSVSSTQKSLSDPKHGRFHEV
jgi:transposase-like protein